MSVKDIVSNLFNAIFPILFIVLFVIFVPKLVVLCTPIVFALILTVIVLPIANKISKRYPNINQAVALSILVILFLIIGYGLYTILFLLLGYTGDFINILPNIFADVKELLLDTLSGLNFNESFKESINIAIEDLYGNIVSSINSIAIPTATGIVRAVPNFFIGIIFAILFSFAFITTDKSIFRKIYLLTPKKIKQFVIFAKEEAFTIFKNWLVAQFRVMFYIFAVLLIGLFILSVSYAPLVAAITAFLDFLPILGVGTVLWPWIVIEILQRDFTRAIGLAILYIATVFTRRVTEPKVMGTEFGISTLTTLLLFYAGYVTYGVVGMLFSIPFGMIIYSLYRYGTFNKCLAAWRNLLTALFD